MKATLKIPFLFLVLSPMSLSPMETDEHKKGKTKPLTAITTSNIDIFSNITDIDRKIDILKALNFQEKFSFNVFQVVRTANQIWNNQTSTNDKKKLEEDLRNLFLGHLRTLSESTRKIQGKREDLDYEENRKTLIKIQTIITFMQGFLDTAEKQSKTEDHKEGQDYLTLLRKEFYITFIENPFRTPYFTKNLGYIINQYKDSYFKTTYNIMLFFHKYATELCTDSAFSAMSTIYGKYYAQIKKDTETFYITEFSKINKKNKRKLHNVSENLQSTERFIKSVGQEKIIENLIEEEQRRKKTKPKHKTKTQFFIPASDDTDNESSDEIMEKNNDFTNPFFAQSVETDLVVWYNDTLKERLGKLNNSFVSNVTDKEITIQDPNNNAIITLHRINKLGNFKNISRIKEAPRVQEWFHDPVKALINRGELEENETGPKFTFNASQKESIARHAFAKIVDGFITEYGISTVYQNKENKIIHNKALIGLLELKDLGITLEGLFAYGFDKQGKCYHRFFEKKPITRSLEEFAKQSKITFEE